MKEFFAVFFLGILEAFCELSFYPFNRFANFSRRIADCLEKWRAALARKNVTMIFGEDENRETTDSCCASLGC